VAKFLSDPNFPIPVMIRVMACEALAGSQVTFYGALGDLDRAECKLFPDRTTAALPAIA
jgi:hypothetical protein